MPPEYEKYLADLKSIELGENNYLYNQVAENVVVIPKRSKDDDIQEFFTLLDEKKIKSYNQWPDVERIIKSDPRFDVFIILIIRIH